MTVIDTICCQFSNEDSDKILNSLIHWKVKTPVLKTIQVDRIVEREVRDGNLVCRKEVFKGKIIRKTSALYHTWCLHQSFLILLILSSTGQEIWVARSDVSYQVFFYCCAWWTRLGGTKDVHANLSEGNFTSSKIQILGSCPIIVAFSWARYFNI